MQIRERILEVCMYKYGTVDLDNLKRVFQDMDRNGNGSIDPVEFRYCMRVWGADFTEEEVT